MNKSIVIAKCLVKSNMASNVRVGEAMVTNVFQSEFPNMSFSEWNSPVSDAEAEDIINRVAGRSSISVRHLIKDFSLN